VGGDDDKFVTI